MDGGIWPLPWDVPSVLTLGLYLHDNKIKTKVAWLITQGTTHLWPFLLFYQKMTQICYCRSISTKPVSRCCWFHGVWVHREKQKACLILLVRHVDSSNPVLVTLTVFGPTGFHPCIPAAGFPPFLRHLPACREWLSLLIATCSANRMNGVWLVQHHYSSPVSGPLCPSFPSVCLRSWHDTVSHVISF